MGVPFRLSPTMASSKGLVLDFIKRYWAEWGISPSYGEISAGVGVSRKRVHGLVRQLAEEALIHKEPGPRGIRLLDPVSEALRVLRERGYIVNGDVHGSIAAVTNAGLPLLPALMHIDDDIGGIHDISDLRRA